MRLSYCACFALCPFLLCKPTYAQDRREFWPGSRRQLRVIEAKIRNCTEAIARMGWSTFLRAQLQDLESQHRELADKLAALEPRVVKSTFRDTRRFVEARLKNLQSMLTGEPRLVRAEIAKHVEKITLTPEGRTYIAAGTWDLLGAVAVRMVPGARHARYCQRLSSLLSWLPSL